MKSFLTVVFFVFIFLLGGMEFIARAQNHTTNLYSKKEYPYTFVNNPLRIPVMKNMSFSGSDIVIEEVLPKGNGYFRYKVSYLSENNKIYGIITVPNTVMPHNGYPGILLAHGYVPERQYNNQTIYQDLIDTLTRNGFIVFMPDLRGHGDSEGIAEGAYFSPAYTIDFLNAFSSLSRFESVNNEKIGVWGHSMGAHIVLRSAIIDARIKSISTWAGVVGDYTDLLYHWNTKTTWNSFENLMTIHPSELIQQFGSPVENPIFWKEISPISYLSGVTRPVQIQHGMQDSIVPYEFSQRLAHQLSVTNKNVELYIYPHENHDFSGQDRQLVILRTLQFFTTTLQ
jgi:dipeptidyl aminopeptidase/acylaminoacyl peptidase